MNNPIEEIKNRLDVVEVISEYIKVKKAGANYRAACPFHSEKKPSFFISPARQIWKCFGCSKGGDIFGFVKEIEGVEFGDALRILARKAGVELKTVRPELRTKRQKLYKICELATMFFEKQLESSKGKKAKQYLIDRTVSEDSIKKWRIGYSPDTWSGLLDFLISRGYTKQDILEVGLVVKNDKGKIYDRFRGRIMFPLFDLNSQVVGFTGRVLETGDSKKRKTIAKYVNTPNTMLYDKGRLLYGLHNAKVEIRKNKACILTEGQVDVILSHQNGIQNLVATSGTALTPFQLNILKRYSDSLILSFDMDLAGDTATKRGIGLAQQKGFDIRIMVLPEGKDPADVISESKDQWEKIISKSRNILDFYFETTLAKFNKEKPKQKKEISKILLPVIKRIPNEIEKSHWVQKLAQELGVKEESIEAELKKTKQEKQESEKETIIQQIEKPQQELIEDHLLLLILQGKKNIDFIQDLEIFSPEAIQVLSSIKKHGLKYDMIKKELPTQLFSRVQVISLEAEIKEKQSNSEKEIKKCVVRIRSLKMKQKLERTSDQIKKAELKKDSEKVEFLTKEFNKLTKEYNKISQE